jgi:two-component system sensor histidine kinase HydH
MKASLAIHMTAPILAVSVLLAGVGVVAAWYVQHLEEANSQLLDHYISGARWAGEFEINIREMRTQLNSFLLTGDRQHLDSVPALRLETDRALYEMNRLTQTSNERELIAEIEKGYRHFSTEYDRLLEEPAASGLVEDTRRLVQKVLTESILVQAHEHLAFNVEMMRRNSTANKAAADRTVLSLILLGTCGAAAGVLAGFAIAQRFRRSIVRLSLPLRDAAGTLNEVVEPLTFAAGRNFQDLEGAMRTIADHVRLVVDKLHQSQREVLRADQLAALGQLAAGLAHELRNPLSSIKILVQSASDEHAAGSLRGRDLVVLEEEITRLEGAMQAFLEFARPPRLEKCIFDLGKLLRQTVDFVGARARSQGARLECTLPASPLPIDADMGQIRQVFLNLILNALDALGRGGTVWVRIPEPASDRPIPDGSIPGARHLTVEVGDTGCGLPEGLGARIFEPFVSTKESGLGLGLSICKRIVETHGGAITAANLPEGGCVFSLHLPAGKS